MIHIIKYDTKKYPPEEIYQIVCDLQNKYLEDNVIGIPYGIDFLYDVPIEELKSFRNTIDKIIGDNE